MNYLQMTPYQFDQTEDGWRGLDKLGKYVESAETILCYTEQNGDKVTGKNPSLQTMYFHAGQEYAMAGEQYYPQAIKCFGRSYKNHVEWDWYVKGTIAFLNKDKAVLDDAIRNNGMNLDILQRFSAALGRNDNSYRSNY